MIIRQIFAEQKPSAGVPSDLYTVPAGSSAKGTLYIQSQTGYDRVSVQLVSATLASPDGWTYILSGTSLVGFVPIYLQQLALGPGDTLRIGDTEGTCSFVFTGEEYVS